MSDWAVGDLAVCVDDSPCVCGCDVPDTTTIAGHIYRVSRIGLASWGIVLVLAGAPTLRNHAHGESATRFRKIRPDEQEACETEFVTLLKRSKRKVAA